MKCERVIPLQYTFTHHSFRSWQYVVLLYSFRTKRTTVGGNHDLSSAAFSLLSTLYLKPTNVAQNNLLRMILPRQTSYATELLVRVVDANEPMSL